MSKIQGPGEELRVPRRSLRAGVVLTLALSTLAVTQVVHADDSPGWLSQPTMTGDWNGGRTALKEAGITPYAAVLNEYARLFSGGKRRGGGVAQQYYFGADFDMGKLAGWQGGIIHVKFDDRSGPGTSARNIGNELEVQSNYGSGQNFRLSEFSYEQRFDGGKYIARFGFLPVGNDFDNMVIPLCDFQNFSFCGHANPLFLNSGDSVYPDGHWGGDLRAFIRPDVYIEAGVWAVNNDYLKSNHGFDVSLKDSDGAIVPIELGWRPQVGRDKLHGDYKLGVYYESSTAKDVAYPQINRHGRYGGYFMANQMLVRFQPDTERGLIGFAEDVVGDTRTSPVPEFFNLGFIVQGPWAHRPTDYIDFGVGHAQVNNRSRSVGVENSVDALVNAGRYDQIGETLEAYGQYGETDYELGYGLRIAPWLLINPNVQYVVNPGAFSHTNVRNAWVFGTQLVVTF
jgi:porin